jgi:hypothetical protein
MHERRIPEWLRHAPAPSVRGFAVLAGTEAIARGILISVFPLIIYRALQDVGVVSKVYFFIGLSSLMIGLLVPYLIRYVPRRWVYAAGTIMFAIGALLACFEAPIAVVVGLSFTTFATVTTFVCFNAYVLDYVSKIELGKLETSRLFYSALGWTNVQATRDGEGLNWHFDRSEFTTTILLQAPDEGGQLEYRSDLRSADDPNYDGVAALLRGEDKQVQQAALSAGALNVFRGVHTLHRVVPVKGSKERLVAIFAFYDRPDVAMTEQEQFGFYGRSVS